jgi:hypothetical protein
MNRVNNILQYFRTVRFVLVPCWSLGTQTMGDLLRRLLGLAETFARTGAVFLSTASGGRVLRALRLRSVLRDQGDVGALSSRVVLRASHGIKDGLACVVVSIQPSHDAVAIHKIIF